MAQTTTVTERPLPAGGAPVARGRSLWGLALQRLLKNKLAVVGLICVGFFILVWLASPLIRRYDPYSYQNYSALLQGPSGAHWFGTDNLGRDNWSRTLTGIGLSMQVGLGVALTVLVVGALVGGIASLGPAWLDNAVMRFTDIMYAFPDLLLIILIQAALQDRNVPAALQIIFAISLVAWVTVARLIRGQMLSLKQRDYVTAAEALGASRWRIVFQHLLPNTLSPVIIAITFAVPGAIFAEAALSFIGIGPATTTSLGRLVSDGRPYVQANPSIILFPAAAISVLMLSFTFIGDGLRDALDPRTR
jgi:oligopeptide transport system permease protein